MSESASAPQQGEVPFDPADLVDQREPVPGGTGEPDVDAALERLRDVDTLPVADHVEVYDDVQRRLAAAMDDTQDGQLPTDAG